MICEKSGQVGGTGATSAGTLWIPGNRQSKAAGFNDSAEAADAYLTRWSATPSRDLRRAYLQTGPDAIDYLSANTDVQFLPCGPHPDYRSNLPGAAIAGRAIVAVPFDGRLLGEDFRRLRPPIPEFMLFGGMMVGKADIARLVERYRSFGSFLYGAKLLARYLLDRLRFTRGTRLMMGNALVGRLFYSLRKRKVPILFDAAIVDVTGSRDGVTGARLNVGGEEIVIRDPQRRCACHRRLCAQQAFPRQIHAVADAAAFDELRRQSGRRPRHRRAARREACARSLHQRSVDAGVGCAAGRRQRRPLSASDARPRQARIDRGEFDGPPFRQRGVVVS